MNWMVKQKKDIGNKNVDKYNKEQITGKTSVDMLNNIYDLYGSNYEWTIEAKNYNARIWRGGGAGSREALSPSNRDYFEPVRQYGNVTTRLTLYVN